MNTLNLRALCDLLEANSSEIDSRLLGASFSGVSIDSRSLHENQLFIAIKGERFDGHDFIPMASDAGALAAVVEHRVDSPLPQLCVTDTCQALGVYAADYFASRRVPTVGITGSCGKTTTKEMLASILRSETQPEHTVLASQGSYNNAIGVPLTLLLLKPSDQFAVIEMGTNHFGEIAELSRWVQPDVALITNVAAAHTENFKSLNGVARAKGELLEALSSTGTAILNADDPYCTYWKGLLNKQKCLTFGVSKGADIRAQAIQLDEQGLASFTLHLPHRQAEKIQLGVLGKHQVINALAASSAAFALGLSMEPIKKGLETHQSVSMRLVPKVGLNDSVLIDDTYNANPTSVCAALEVLAHAKGERLFIFADMAELNGKAIEYHREVGEQARTLGIEHVYALGVSSRTSVEAFGPQGRHFEDKASLIKAAQKLLKPGMTVLLKGSRFNQLESVTKALEKK